GSWKSPRTWVAEFVLPAKAANPPAEIDAKKPPFDKKKSTKNDGDKHVRPFSILVEEVEDFASTSDEPANPPLPPAEDGPTGKASDRATVNETKGAPATGPNSQPGPFDVWIIAGDEVEAGLERTGPRFLSRIEIEV